MTKKTTPTNVEGLRSAESKPYSYVPAAITWVSDGGIGIYVRYGKYPDRITVKERGNGYIWVQCPDRELVLVANSHMGWGFRPMQGTFDEYIHVGPYHDHLNADMNLPYFMVNYVAESSKPSAHTRHNAPTGYNPNSMIMADSGGYQILQGRVEYLDPLKIVEWYNDRDVRGDSTYPTWARTGHIVDKHNITILYTAPTAIRAMMREGDAFVRESDRSSLRLLGSVGEPINPEAWNWYYTVVGESRCPIVDTWWQTETGGILISPLPGTTPLIPGSAARPLFGVKPALVDAEGQELEGVAEGNLIIKDSWPGQMRTIWGDPERFIEAYFATYPGAYFTGDGARRDADGYYWITGRVDDVLNVSGHRLGTAEVESALVAHEKVAEAAVVGMPHEIKGQGIAAYVTLQAGESETEELRKELVVWVRKVLGPVATPDAIYWAPSLPKTRSGKIMRRILRKIVANELDSLGDTSTLADPSVVDQLIAEVKANS